jgi:hypothetical protein
MSNAEFIEIETTDSAESPTLAEVMRALSKNISGQINVAVPAKVINYNKDTQTVDARPVFQLKYLDGSIQDPPVIYSIPVLFPRANNAFISFPIRNGDNVFLIFADKSIDKWMTSGEVNYPDDVRKHDISDAFALPAGYPMGQSASIANGDDVIISNALGTGGTEVRIKPNGHIQILNGREELVSVLNLFMASACSANLGGMYAALNKLQSFLEN